MNPILDILARHASQQPDTVALQTCNENVSYADLYTRVQTTAAWLTQLNVRTIACQLDNSIDWAIIDLAVMQAGLNSIPLPCWFSQGQVEHVIADAGVDLFITHPDVVIDARWQLLTTPTGASVESFLTGQAGGHAATLSNTKITYTSGSTGSPRGVCLPVKTLTEVSQAILDAMSQINIERHLCVLPLATLLENIAGFYAPLMRGITVYLATGSELGLGANQLDPGRFADVINAVQPDSVILVPQLLTALVEFEMIHWNTPKMIAVGGGRISDQLIMRARERDLPVYQGYGLSECASVVTLCLPGANRAGSVGRALPHAKVRISQDGEIEVHGARMTGYLGAPRIDEDWLRTGDLGHLDDDGYLFVDGRLKNVFITAYGRNVNPEWVESALTQQAPISQALVYGEAENHNLALLWLRFGQDDSQVEAAVALANAELPGYAQVHAYIAIDEPLTPSLVTDNGRLKRGVVIDQYQDLIKQHFANGESSRVVL